MNEARILERTSRSFYLTLRLLPRAVRGDASLGYLIARATDTIADTSLRPAEERAGLLRCFVSSLGRKTIQDYVPAEWCSAQADAAERGLLSELPVLWRRMALRPPAARERLVRMMSHILEGQIFDLERFGRGTLPLSDVELERYTFLVAGSVGEFWTDLCIADLRDFSIVPADELRIRARLYGQALQLVNILRDRRTDAASGRTYVRDEDVARYIAQAREWLAESVPYCLSVRCGRIRYATLLPALLGWRTLVLIDSPASGSTTPVKVPRAEVRRWMFRALPVWWSSAAVRDVAAAAAS